MIERLHRARRQVHLLTGTAAALVRHHVFGHRVPLSVTLAPTNRCQGRCDYCGIWQLRQGEERPVAWWIDLIRALAAHGTRRLGFTGGEALLYDGLDRLVAEARRRRLLVSLGTNGLLVPEREDVVRRVDFLIVSVDGPATVNDAQRFRGSHEAAVGAIEVARRVGTRVWLTAVVTRQSAPALRELLSFAARHGVRVNLQLPFHPVGYCGRDNQDRFPTPDQIDEILRIARAHSHPGGLVLNSPAYWDHIERWHHLGATALPRAETTGRRRDGLLNCSGGALLFHVEPDGRVYACTQLSGQTPALAPGDGTSLAAALRRASESACGTCLASTAQELTLLFHLSDGSVGTWIREVLSDR